LATPLVQRLRDYGCGRPEEVGNLRVGETGEAQMESLVAL
jgi:hypothetical protein